MMAVDPQEKTLADIGNRAAAWLLDLFLLGFVAATAGEFLGSYAFPLLALFYFVGMPLSPLQGTLGKWISRIKLCDRHGDRLTWRASVVRFGAQACWFAVPFLLNPIPPFGNLDGPTLSATWWVLFALPWAPAGFMPRRVAFDLLAGSLVVRYKATPQSIAGASPERKRGILKALNAGIHIVLCLAIGAMFSAAIEAGRYKNLYPRVAYAIEQTLPVRQKIAEFHDVHRRWPTAAEIGSPEWTPYSGGGGYRVHADGSIVITFSVLPELKGRSIAFRPTRGEDGVQWKCHADAGIKSSYLPGSCRLGR